jgi:hypothetical protein
LAQPIGEAYVNGLGPGVECPFAPKPVIPTGDKFDLSPGERPLKCAAPGAVQTISSIIHAIIAETLENRAKRLLIGRWAVVVVGIAELDATGAGVVNVRIASLSVIRHR